jgi:hypothetical protein
MQSQTGSHLDLAHRKNINVFHYASAVDVFYSSTPPLRLLKVSLFVDNVPGESSGKELSCS